MGRCMVCRPRHCRPEWLYVVASPCAQLVKLGRTCNVNRRLYAYTREDRSVVLLGSWPAGCEARASDAERKALRTLRRTYPNPRGDWFSAPWNAVQAVAELAASRSPKGPHA